MKKLSIFLILLDMFLLLFVSSQSKLNSTINQIKHIGLAVERYIDDNGHAPEVTNIEALAKTLSPGYLGTCPQQDGWGKEIYYCTQPGIPGSERKHNQYWIGSGAGGPEFGGFLKYILRTDQSGEDIVFSNGEFISKPMDPKLV